MNSIIKMIKTKALFFIVGLLLIMMIVVGIIDGYRKNQEIRANPAGYGLPLFITNEMMEALFKTQEKCGIPVSSGLAQIIAESGFGKYGEFGDVGEGLSKLAANYNNLFGVKFWDGDSYAIGSVDMETGEQTKSGDSYTVNAGFSVYKSHTASIRQRAEMLKREPYYSKTLAVFPNKNDGRYTPEDAKGFVTGIWEAGWATDVSYVEKLVKLMDYYNLYQFDNMTYKQFRQGQETEE